MPNTSLNVASHLARMAADHPTQVAVHFPRRGVKPTGTSEHIAITFAELNADADAIAHGLVAAGITRGTRTALMVPPSPDFFALTFALFKVAAVPVLIDPGMGVRNLGRCIADAEPQAFVGIAKANAARRVLGWGKKTIRATVNAGRWRFLCNTSLARLRLLGQSRGAYPIPDVARDEPAAVLFTSGSTGIAKGAEYTHGIFAAQVDSLKATYGIEPGEIDLCTFPLFALFGPALGMTCVIPDMNPTRPAQLDPRKAVAQIRQFGVTNMFGSPAVIRRLGDWAASLENPAMGIYAARLPTLRRVISAGAPASAASLERFVKLLCESAQVFTPYGATEALPVANIGSREILGETRRLTEQGKGVCIGRPVAGMEVAVIPISDEPIPEWSDALRLPAGEIGEFVVRGPVVTQRYFNRPESTALAKIRDPNTGEVLHRMGDVGYIDDTGRMWFCGRKSHRVVTPHGTLFTDMVEPIFNTVPGVLRTALVGVTRDGATHPVLCVEYVRVPGVVIFDGTEHDFHEDDLRAVGQQFNLTREIITFLEHPGFPVDVRHNSKIFREKLAVWADKQLGKNWSPTKAHGQESVGVEGST
ncbi:MAG: peptide synthase [Planctomycetaceae bacterium]|nr:peptide synthase [Planctomycetaceae bacterium]